MCGYVSYTEEMPLSGAERQRRHREKIKKDPKKLQQYKLKKHEFYLKTKKSIEFMNDREQHDVENDEKQLVVNPARTVNLELVFVLSPSQSGCLTIYS